MLHSLPHSTSDVHVPSSNTAATLTYAAVSGQRHVISGVAWSYSATPTNGNLKIEDGAGSTIFSLDVSTSGPGFIPFSPPLSGSPSTALIVTLSAGGSSVSGKVNVLGHSRE